MPIDGSDFPLIGQGFSAGRLLGTQPAAVTDIKASKLRNLQPTAEQKNEQAEKAAKDFEALLLHQMMTSMWRSIPKHGEGLLSGSREEELYRDMFNEALSKSMAESQSLGIADIIGREMKQKDLK